MKTIQRLRGFSKKETTATLNGKVRIVCALAVRGGSPVSRMYVVMCRLGPTGCNSSMS